MMPAATPVVVPSASRNTDKILHLMVKESLWVFAAILGSVTSRAVFDAVVDRDHSPRGFGLVFLGPALGNGFVWLASEVYFCASRTRQQAATRQEWCFLVASSVAFSLAHMFSKIFLLTQSFAPSTMAVLSLAPAIVMGIGSQFFGKTFSKSRKLAVALVVMGMVLTYNYERKPPVPGLALLALSVVLTASKDVLNGEMLAGDMEMSPVQLISRLAPLGLAQSLFLAYAFGELTVVVHNSSRILFEEAVLVPVSFAVNLCLLQATKVTSPLAISITCSVYQVLWFAIAWYAPRSRYTPTSDVRMLGFVVVVAATICYAVLSVAERLRPLRQAPPPSPSPSTELRGRTIEGGVADAGDDMNIPLLEAEVQSTASQEDRAAYTAEHGRQQTSAEEESPTGRYEL